MGSYTHKLSFSMHHSSADLSIVPTTLNMAPFRLWRAGEQRTAPNGRLLDGTYTNSSCNFEFEVSPNGLPKSLEHAVAKLKPHSQFLNDLADAGVNFRFFIGWFSEFNSADRLEWRLLLDIAALKISLDFDFYGPDETKSESSE